MKKCEMVGAVIGYQTMERTQVCSWFSKFKNCVTFLKMPDAWDIH
jgi:hypothetical protein